MFGSEQSAGESLIPHPSPRKIRVVIPDKDGNEAIFSFDFETKVSYKIRGSAWTSAMWSGER
jgi:hypothetical protein